MLDDHPRCVVFGDLSKPRALYFRYYFTRLGVSIIYPYGERTRRASQLEFSQENTRRNATFRLAARLFVDSFGRVSHTQARIHTGSRTYAGTHIHTPCTTRNEAGIVVVRRCV